MLLHPLPWPDGKRLAAAITFDIDADSLIRNARLDDGHLRLAPVSMGRYGPTVAVPRILDSYRRLGLRQTFFIPAWVMETYPATVEMILKDGHEIGHHSWRHEDPMGHSDAREAELFGRAMEVHQRLTGMKPRGYRAPVYNATPGVIERLVTEGFLYDSSLMADEMPYLLRAPAGELIELPPHWGNDDWPPFAHFEEIGYLMPVRAPSDGIRAFVEEYQAAREVGGFWMPVLHPFLTGRLARWQVLERWLEEVLTRGEAWFAPLEEIARHAAQHRDDLRVDEVPGPEGV
ncbi:polysaccharide deacetylase family protein [Mameliella alba]|uniref:polysaccharide deacetylase family protein n=1 Tax=Mameliella alba TaxID=561184 RepID=UPI000B52C606|nr:polysaccharide deacetylase [Mameliella alba]MBY6119271.1 polysaccharide deacetylase [Mameliella alba]OWV45079.1 ribulose phosphate epimerase [Mameliella alba]OWV66729.1 ribulose phosphate epimerase [Mameliella alba]